MVQNALVSDNFHCKQALRVLIKQISEMKKIQEFQRLRVNSVRSIESDQRKGKSR